MKNHRLELQDLFDIIENWDSIVKSELFLAACGGTAVSLYDCKESTKDVDFLIPDLSQHARLVKQLIDSGYSKTGGYGYSHPNKPLIFDLFRGQEIFSTGLLDPIQEEGNHTVIKKYKKITLACINPDDLVISKMFRGHKVDVDDCMAVLAKMPVNITALANRYLETASYYHNPDTCRKNLSYLITDMKSAGMETAPLEEIQNKWNL